MENPKHANLYLDWETIRSSIDQNNFCDNERTRKNKHFRRKVSSILESIKIITVFLLTFSKLNRLRRMTREIQEMH